MKALSWLREILVGLLVIGAVAALVMGAFALTLAEGRGFGFQAAPSATQPQNLQPTPAEVLPVKPTPSANQPQVSATPIPPTSCPPPNGWNAHTVAAGETLESFALSSGLSIEELRQVNCLLADTLPAGSLIYLPPLPTATAAILPENTSTVILPSATRTNIPCGAPAGWVRYTVQLGDTLSALSRAYGVSIYQLQTANCLPSANFIVAGQILYVPNVPTRTPTPTITGTRTSTQPATPITGTPTPTSTSTSTSTGTATATSTPTATGTPTPTPTPSETPTATATETETSTATPTTTATPSKGNPFP